MKKMLHENQNESKTKTDDNCCTSTDENYEQKQIYAL